MHHYFTDLLVARLHMGSVLCQRFRVIHDQKLIFPRWQCTSNMANTISKKSTESNPKAIGSIPETNTNGLFSSGVPHTGYQHEAWIRACFGGTGKDSEDSECGEVVTCSLKHEEEAPVLSVWVVMRLRIKTYHMKILKPRYLPERQLSSNHRKKHQTGALTNRQPLQQKICRKSPDQEPKIKQTTQPVVLRPNEMEIIPNPEYSSIAKRCLYSIISPTDLETYTCRDERARTNLINIKKRITNRQIRQNHKVDLA